MLKRIFKTTLSILVLSFCIVLFSIFSLAEGQTETYPYSGGNNSDYALGVGSWIDPVDAQVTGSVLLTDPKQIPYVGDLDNNGNKEIIVFDSTSIEIYRGSMLDPVYAKDTSSTPVSNIIIFDIDGDGFKEILFLSGTSSADLQIIEYNGTSISQDTIPSIISAGAGARQQDTDIAIQCRGVNDCIAVFPELTSNAVTPNLRARIFNSTSGIGSHTSIDTGDGGGNGLWCIPKGTTPQVIDSNGDGEDNYVFSSMERRGVTDLAFSIYELETSTGSISTDVVVNSELTDSLLTQKSWQTSTSVCSEEALSVTNVIAYNYDNTPGTEEDFAIGFMKSDTEFNINVYSNSGSLDHNFPDGGLDGDGPIISNLFRGSFISDDSNDVCVIGLNPAQGSDPNQLDMVCARKAGSVGVDQIFQWEEAEDLSFNVTETSDLYSHIVHSAEYDNVAATSEVLTPFGIFDAGDFSQFDFFQELVESSFKLGGVEASVISIDANNDNSDDLLLLTDTNLFYIDDGLTNQDAVITNVTFNPCPIGTIIKVNESMLMQVYVDDLNSLSQGLDDVSASVIIYKDTANEQRFDSANTTSGTPIPFNFVLNETITTGVIEVIGRDDVNMVEDTDTFFFTVTENGIGFGDSLCSIDTFAGDDSEGAETADAAFLANNTITRGADQLGQIIFLTDSVSPIMRTIIWVILMIIVAVLILVSPTFFNPMNSGRSSPMMALIGVGIVEFLMLFLGVLFGFIGIGIIISIVVIAIAIVALMFRDSFLGRMPQ